MLPPSDSCEFHYNTDQAGGCAKCGKAKRWGIPIMKDPANPAGQAQCDNSTRETPLQPALLSLRLLQLRSLRSLQKVT